MLRGTSPPLVVCLILLAIVVYQFATSKLINLTWGVWLNRVDRPAAYWSVLSIEAAVALLGLYFGLHSI